MNVTMDVVGTFRAPGAGTCNVYRWEPFKRHGKEYLRVWLDCRPYFESPCKAHMMLGGACFTSDFVERGEYMGVEGSYVLVENVHPIPATPTLDELTDPADLDWGALRSAADDRRDWREAWGIVGTDHTGDATPGEVYLLSVARHKSATAAALWQWRQAEKDSGTIFLGADAARAWARIKHIAAWESSARAQYVKRPPSAKQKRMEWLNERIRPGAFQPPDDILGGRYSTVNVGDLVIDDPVTITPEWAASHDRLADLLQAAMPAGLSLGYRTAEDDAVTRGNGRGVVGVLNNPFLTAAAQRGEITGTVTIPPSTSATIAAALERYASLTGNAMNVQGNGRGGIVVTPRNTNPAPRGPQTRKRR